jgi:hypothetical protein
MVKEVGNVLGGHGRKKTSRKFAGRVGRRFNFGIQEKWS